MHCKAVQSSEMNTLLGINYRNTLSWNTYGNLTWHIQVRQRRPCWLYSIVIHNIYTRLFPLQTRLKWSHQSQKSTFFYTPPDATLRPRLLWAHHPITPLLRWPPMWLSPPLTLLSFIPPSVRTKNLKTATFPRTTYPFSPPPVSTLFSLYWILPTKRNIPTSWFYHASFLLNVSSVETLAGPLFF